MSYLVVYGPLDEDSNMIRKQWLAISRSFPNQNTAAIHAFVDIYCSSWNKEAQRDYIHDLTGALGDPPDSVPDSISKTVAIRLDDMGIDLETNDQGVISQIDWEDENADEGPCFQLQISPVKDLNKPLAELAAQWLKDHVTYIS